MNALLSFSQSPWQQGWSGVNSFDQWNMSRRAMCVMFASSEGLVCILHPPSHPPTQQFQMA